MTGVFRTFFLAGILFVSACHSCSSAGGAERHLGAGATCAGSDKRIICNQGDKSYLCAVSYTCSGYRFACAPYTPVEAQ